MRGETNGNSSPSCTDNISIHSPHARGDDNLHECGLDRLISIHSPHARGDASPAPAAPAILRHFNPLPSCEGRQDRGENPAGTVYFNPLPSCEGRQSLQIILPAHPSFQSTPLMRGETVATSDILLAAFISIHSPHARGDRPCWKTIAA